MGHIILLGDSIFDNAAYVPGQPAVIDQLRHALPTSWQATLLAVDGHITADIATQAQRIPSDATHLLVSSGGNDALGASQVLGESVRNVAEALEAMHRVQERFKQVYRQMLGLLRALNKPSAVCTIYNAIPGLGSAARLALGGFNEVILLEAFAAGLPVIDLRLICNQASDYSKISPIEPSHAGGAKIARVIADVTTKHNFDSHQSVIYI
jgi:hypothetical protein